MASGRADMDSPQVPRANNCAFSHPVFMPSSCGEWALILAGTLKAADRQDDMQGSGRELVELKEELDQCTPRRFSAFGFP